jgi:hypothetical protein
MSELGRNSEDGAALGRSGDPDQADATAPGGVATKGPSARLANDRFSAAGRRTLEIPMWKISPFCRLFARRSQLDEKRSGSKRSGSGARIPSIEVTRDTVFAGTFGSGSDGTRTRDFGRDRPLQRSRRAQQCTRERTVHAVLRWPPGRLRMATRCGSRRLLPICCPLDPSLPFRCARNYWRPEATDSACLGRFGRCRTCAGSPPFAPALLHKRVLVGRAGSAAWSR